MNDHGERIREASKLLELSEAEFQHVEVAYFARGASVADLRTAWTAREQARRRLADAHREAAAARKAVPVP